MRLIILGLGSIAAFLMSCAAGSGLAGLSGEAATSYRQEAGPVSRSFPATRSASPSAAEPGHQLFTHTRQALLSALNEVERPRSSIDDSLRKLADSRSLAGRANGLFTRHLGYGSHQLQWLHGALSGATPLAAGAWEVDDPGLGLALLRLSGPRLEAAMSGTTLLAAWVDFLNLAEAVLRQCPAYSVERLFMDLNRVQQMLEPSLKALSSLDSEQVEAATVAMPELMGRLAQEFHSI